MDIKPKLYTGPMRTTETDRVGDVWKAHGRPTRTVVGKFNDWCLFMTHEGSSPHGMIMALCDLFEMGYKRHPRPADEH